MNRNDEIEENKTEWSPMDEEEIDLRNRNGDDNQMLSGSDTNSRERLINRIMAGGGILIAGFTIFYVVTFYSLFSGGKEANAAETTELLETQPETTTEDDSNYILFVSPYSDEKISESTKTLLNQAVPGEPLVTGILSVDNRVSSVSRSTMGANMTQYEKIRNVYDYMLYNFRRNDTDSVDEEEIDNLCEGFLFKSRFDMQMAYRTERILRNFAGTSGDYAAAFALVLRKMGLEAYYIDDETENSGDYEEHGYTAVKINSEYYIFDPFAEKKQMEKNRDSENRELDYTYFCVALKTAGNEYDREDVETAAAKFENFATLPAMNFEAMISNKSASAFGSVAYRSSSNLDGNSDMAEGELYVSAGDTINLAGTVTSTGADNIWKLKVEIYDNDMNYLDEQEIYNQTTSSAYNEVSYTASRGRYVQLYYSVTDIYGRTCEITHIFKIWTADDYTTRPEPTTDEPVTEPLTEPSSDDITEPANDPEPESTAEPETEAQTTTKDREPETTSREEETTEDKTEPKTDETTDDVEDETTSNQDSNPTEPKSNQTEE